MPRLNSHLAAARIVQDAGGELVGRTRLQKIAFLLNLAGLEDGFSFEYRHYGPFSEELAEAMDIAVGLRTIQEEERTADWGGRYSIYRLVEDVAEKDSDRELFVQEAKRIDAVELELAATAAYLFVHEGIESIVDGNPWQETRRRKPSKAAGQRLEKAAASYERLRQADKRQRLPTLPSP